MKDCVHVSDTALNTPADASDLHAKFLALKQQAQGLAVEIADWNGKKTKLKRRRRWSKKRQLVPPALKAQSVRPSGAQPCNSNRLSHGKRTRSKQLFLAAVRTEIRASYALVVYVKHGILGKGVPQIEQR